MGKKKTLKKYRNKGKWVECNYYPSLKGSIGDKNRIDWGDYLTIKLKLSQFPISTHPFTIRVSPMNGSYM